MLITPLPENDGFIDSIHRPFGTDWFREPDPQRQSSIMATETKFTEARAEGAPITTTPPEPVLELQHIDSKQSRSPPPLRYVDNVFSVPAHPLFPPLPSYGPPSTFDSLRYFAIRCISFVLSLLFLGVIVLGAVFRTVGTHLIDLRLRLSGRNPKTQRKFYTEEQARRLERRNAARTWKLRQEKREVDEEAPDEYPPLEGGKDPVIGDVAYYARRVGLDVETFKVQTEDGYIITLWHVYNPQEDTPTPMNERRHRGPHVFTGHKHQRQPPARPRRKYPVLMMHGLLQNSGAYCANDDDSLAFFLCKSGYDVWLGNNRCGLQPEHATLSPSDPRMWSWTIQHMGVLDLTALTSRVLYETGFEKLGLVCHSQGTAQTFIALAKEQRPDLGDRISVFCALAPAVYAGPLVERVYFRFMRRISPSTFRLFFGIHAFIPFMVTARHLLHPRLYGPLGFMVFSFLFSWSDTRWDRGLRNRLFQFAPVYVSTETIRWWLGGNGFSTQKCILATTAELEPESEQPQATSTTTTTTTTTSTGETGRTSSCNHDRCSWYGPQTPPLALWIGGKDQLVDGRRLLERLRSGREPHVQVVHAKVIEDYEHLDVLWAMDMIEQVGRELRQVLWDTVPASVRVTTVVPRGVA